MHQYSNIFEKDTSKSFSLFNDSSDTGWRMPFVSSNTSDIISNERKPHQKHASLHISIPKSDSSTLSSAINTPTASTPNLLTPSSTDSLNISSLPLDRRSSPYRRTLSPGPPLQRISHSPLSRRGEDPRAQERERSFSPADNSYATYSKKPLTGRVLHRRENSKDLSENIQRRSLQISGRPATSPEKQRIFSDALESHPIATPNKQPHTYRSEKQSELYSQYSKASLTDHSVASRSPSAVSPYSRRVQSAAILFSPIKGVDDDNSEENPSAPSSLNTSPAAQKTITIDSLRPARSSPSQERGASASLQYLPFGGAPPHSNVQSLKKVATFTPTVDEYWTQTAAQKNKSFPSHSTFMGPSAGNSLLPYNHSASVSQLRPLMNTRQHSLSPSLSSPSLDRFIELSSHSTHPQKQTDNYVVAESTAAALAREGAAPAPLQWMHQAWKRDVTRAVISSDFSDGYPQRGSSRNEGAFGEQKEPTLSLASVVGTQKPLHPYVRLYFRLSFLLCYIPVISIPSSLFLTYSVQNTARENPGHTVLAEPPHTQFWERLMKQQQQQQNSKDS